MDSLEKVNWGQHHIILMSEVMGCEMLCWKGEKSEQCWDRYI